MGYKTDFGLWEGEKLMDYTMDAIVNFRDLSDVPLRAGRRVRPGALLRCGELYHATEADALRLERDFGVKYIVDFRDPGERQDRPDCIVAGAENVSIPVLPPIKDNLPPPPAAGKPGAPQNIDEIFRTIYQQLSTEPVCTEAYRRFFRLLLEADGAPVLWHCRQGKDRTGIAALLVLSAFGADEDAIRADYMHTNDFLQSEFERLMAKAPDATWEKAARDLCFVRADFLQLYCERIEALWGGAEGYLRDGIGLTDAELDALRAAYLT